MTKFLVDENIPPAVIEWLKLQGLDVKDVYDLSLAGATDDEIMALAQAEARIILTFDQHFADILRYPLDSHAGVIRLRIHPPLIGDITDALARFLQQFDLTTLPGTLVVLEREGFRVR